MKFSPVSMLVLMTTLSWGQAVGTFSAGTFCAGACTASPVTTVQLPTTWVNSLEWIGTTSNTISFPASSPGGTWTCTGVGSFGPYTPDSQSSLQQAINDAENCRINGTGHPGTQINIPAGHLFSGTGGITLPQTAGDLVSFTNFIVLQSTSSLTTGQTVCSHGIQDNLA